MAPRAYKTADLARAVREAIIGMPVKTLEVDRFGKITVQMAVLADGADCDKRANEWDEVLKKDRDGG